MIKKTLLTSSLFLALNAMADNPAVGEKVPLTALETSQAEFIDEDPEDSEPVCLFAPCNTPSGFYFTANVGMTSFNQNAQFQYGGDNAGNVPFKIYTIKLKSTEAPFIGAGFGYLWDIHKFATTIEYSFQIDTLKANQCRYPTPYSGAAGDSSDHTFSKKTSHNLNWTIGYRIFKAYTPYVGIGITRGQFAYHYNHPLETVNYTASKSVWGTVFSAGLRVALTDHAHLKIEYQLQDFPKWNTGELDPKWNVARPTNVIELKPKFQTLLFGVSYKF